jgi:uncharacterized protein YjbJ (UPF0337 family)
MNWDRVKGNWKQLKGLARAGWGTLIDDHVIAMAGRREICAGKLQEAYGIGREEAGRSGGATVKPIREAEGIREVAHDDDTGLHRIDARQ